MNAKTIMLAVAVAVIGAAALMMCDDADAAAGDVLASGSCGTNLSYEVKSLSDDDSQVELVISGSGVMTGYTSTTIPWISYQPSITKITLPDGLTSIGKYAFYRCTSITSIELPATLTSIEFYSFEGCTSITSITLPESMSFLDSSAFSGCLNLRAVINYSNIKLMAGFGGYPDVGRYAHFIYTPTQEHPYEPVQSDYKTASVVVIPDCVTSIGEQAFQNNTSLTHISIPDTVTSINSNSFYGCTSLSSINLPVGLTYLATGIFTGCTNLTEIGIPTGIRSISSYAFSGCTSLSSIELPSGISDIGYGAFSNCTNLAEIELPSSLRSISNNLFDGCVSLVSVVIPDSVTSIGYLAFNGCTNLAEIELPTGLKSIGYGAFSNCTSLASIELPTGLTGIGDANVNHARVFDRCTSLKTAIMPAIASNTRIGLANLESLTYTTSVDWSSTNIAYAPQYTSRATLQSITFPDDHLPSFALYGQNLDTLTITNAAGNDVLGVYVEPTTRATTEDLTVTGLAAQIVRLTDIAGAAELVDGGITANDVDVHWNTTPEGYATGEVDVSPEVLVYPAGIHTSAPNQYAGLINAIPLIVIVAIITTIIGMMAARRD